MMKHKPPLVWWNVCVVLCLIGKSCSELYYEPANTRITDTLSMHTPPGKGINEHLIIELSTRTENHVRYVRRNKRLDLSVHIHTQNGEKIAHQKLDLAKMFAVFDRITTCKTNTQLQGKDKNVGFYRDDKSSTFMVNFLKDGNHLVHGFFFNDSYSYTIKPHTGNQTSHNLTKQSINNWDSLDPSTNEFEEQKIFFKGKKRHKRQIQLYEIELFMAVDFSIYQIWFLAANASSDAERARVTLESITRHYALIVNGIDARFKTIAGSGYVVDILFAGIYIATEKASSSWTELTKVSSSTTLPVVSEKSLTLFADWSIENKHQLSGSDHMMALTSYNIANEGNFKTLGLSYKQSMCTNRSVSIVEDHGNIAYVSYIAAHELAHSLGAKHDGVPATVKYGPQTRSCSMDDGYLMSPRASSEPSKELAKHLRSWQFSECTLLYFRFYIDYLNKQHRNCMTERVTQLNTDLDFGTTYGARRSGITPYHPDEQCERVQGVGSFMLRHIYRAELSNICKNIPCSDLTNKATYIPVLAMEGTPCGRGKLCLGGKCEDNVLYDSRCDEVDNKAYLGSCLFGDQPENIAETGLTCTELVGTRGAHNCYQYGHNCCQTCEQHRRRYTSLPDCEFGDRKETCDESECDSSVCCETCAILRDKIAVCPHLPPPPNGHVATNTGTLYHGSVATFTCLAGYNLDGNVSSTCSEDGSWSSEHVPKCYRGCPRLCPFSHSVFNLNTGNYSIGTIASFKCENGFMSKGNTTLTCTENASWSDQEPLCILEFSTALEINVKENVKPLHKVHRLATGGAESLFKLVSYSNPGFQVTYNGDVMVVEGGVLDYENICIYTLHVQAVSELDSRMMAYQMLTIRVEDINEFKPQFTLDEYCVPVMTYLQTGYRLLQVSATDADASEANITYRLLTDSTDTTDIFQIDDTTGDVIISSPRGLNSSVSEIYLLYVQAVDNGLPWQLTATSLVRVCVGFKCQHNGVLDLRKTSSCFAANIVCISIVCFKSRSFPVLFFLLFFLLGSHSGIFEMKGVVALFWNYIVSFKRAS